MYFPKRLELWLRVVFALAKASMTGLDITTLSSTLKRPPMLLRRDCDDNGKKTKHGYKTKRDKARRRKTKKTKRNRRKRDEENNETARKLNRQKKENKEEKKKKKVSSAIK